MKMKILMVAVALVFSGAVMADEHGRRGNNDGINNTAKAQAQSGSTGTVINQPITEASVIPTDTKLRNTPGFAMSGPASGPCNGTSGGLGLSLPGFGGGINFSAVDEGCEERETARILALMGHTEDGLALLKSGQVWQRHLKRQQEIAAQKKAAAPAPVQASTAPQVVASSDPTCMTDEFMARRLNKPVCK